MTNSGAALPTSSATLPDGDRSPATASVVAACPWCGLQAADAWWPGSGQAGFQLVECRGCQLVFTSPSPSPQQLADCYGTSYFGHESRRFAAWGEWLVRRFRQQRAAVISRYVAPGRALDIGCGRGHTLDALRQRGWEVVGVELNDSAAQHARQVLGLDVRTGGFDARDWPDRAFDAIVLWHVLEHLPRPRETLAGCARMLKPGGVLALAVPNLASWQARWTRYSWFHADLPRHLSHFQAAWLADRLVELGFAVPHSAYTCWEQNPFGWIQSLLNRAGLPHNLLYDLIRRAEARHTKGPWRRHPWASLASLAGGALLLPPAVAMMLPEAICAAGPTVQLFALRVTDP